MLVGPLKNRRGQAVIEMAISLPFIIWLLFYTINAYFSVHTAQIGQKYAAMGTFQRIDNRANFVVDGVSNSLSQRKFTAVQYQSADGAGQPQRKIIRGPITIRTVIGVCREPRCN